MATEGSARPAVARRYALLALLLCFFCGHDALAEAQILVVFEPDKETHLQVLRTLESSLGAASGGNPGVSIRTADAEAVGRTDTDALATGQPPGLVVTVGTRAAEVVLDREDAAPVLSVLLPKAAYARLAGGAGRSSDRIGGIVLDQPVRRQFAVARALLPESRRASVLLSADDSDLLHQLEEAARAFRFELDVYRVGPDEDPTANIEQMVRGNDVVVAVYDHKVFGPVVAKWMLYLGMQTHRPVIGFSLALLKAGAVAAVFSTPEEIGQHAGERVIRWLHGGEPLGGLQYPRYFQIGVNAPVADTIGLGVPDAEAVERAVHDALEARP